MKAKFKQMDRRDFVKISGLTSIAILYTPVSLADHSSRGEQAIFANETIPVLKQCDVVVLGGGFAGVSAATTFAQAGKKVVLVERRIYLGREVTAEYRPWIDPNNLKESLPNVIQTCIEPEIKQPKSTKRLLRFDHVKRSLEDILFENGVDIVYSSNVIQLLGDKKKVQGLVIGNKSGRQAILSKLVMDCTETAAAVHLTNQKFNELAGKSPYIRTLEYTNVNSSIPDRITVPKHLGILRDEVNVHQGYLGGGHYYIECPMEFENPKFDAFAVTDREASAWEKSLEVAKFLYQNVEHFRDAYLTNSSFKLHGTYTPMMQDMGLAKKRSYLNDQIRIENSTFGIGAFATPYENLFCISEAAVLDDEQKAIMTNPVGTSRIAEALVEKIDSYWLQIASINAIPIVKDILNQVSQSSGTIKEKYSPQRGKPYDRVQVDNMEIPVIDEVDILVAGGGTSGAVATYTSANEGKKTLVIDLNPGFGGTGTYGGVQSYWGPGDYYGFTAKHVEKTTKINKQLSKFFPDNGYGLWSVEAKTAMWLEEIRKSGAKILWNSFVIGSIMEGNKIVGVVVSTPNGTIAVKAKVVIDATGDGDVAAFSGAPYFFGSEHNNVPLWYALRTQSKPGPTGSAFESTVDVTNIEDYTRSVHVALRARGRDLHDHQPYLAPRASRHILGDVLTTLTDNLSFREWEDAINIHRANTDMKGYHDSDWFRIGLIPPNLPMELPYRALTPQKIENLIISGKAFSTHHDSAAALRMQPDLENLGGVTALAAVQSLDENVLVRHIDVKRLQKELVNMGILPEKFLDRKIKPRNYSADDIRLWIRKFEPEQSLKAMANTAMTEIRYDLIPFVEVCTAPSELAVPVLEKELQNTSGKMQLLVARALAMHGSDSGALVIYNEIEDHLNSGILPPLDEYVEHSGGSDRTPPDQGAAPLCANLIYALGMTRSDLNIPVIEMVSQIFTADEQSDFRSKENGLFFYLDAVSFAAELTGNKEVIPSLERIHSNQFLNNKSLKKGIEETHVMERLALMELILGRAMARCGSASGYNILIEYLDDMRAVLAEFAHGTLQKITKIDHGKDKVKWNQWLSINQGSLKSSPWAKRNLE